MATKDNYWDLRRLELFFSVAKEGSLKEVASKLGIRQSVISRQISRLEEECHGRLFARTGRGMVLTELGEQFVPVVARVLGELDSLSRVVSENVTNPIGNVTIGSLPSLYLSVIVPLFQLVQQQYPGIRLQILEGSGGQIDQWLSNGDIDIGLPYRYGTGAQPDADRLFDFDSYLISATGTKFRKRQNILFRELHGLPLVLPGSPSSVRGLLEQLARRAEISINVVIEADSTQLQKALVAQTGLYTILPVHVVKEEVSGGQLQAIPIEEPMLRRSLALAATHARPASLAVRSVLSILRQHLTTDNYIKNFIA